MRGRLFGRLSVETRFACCRPDSSQLPMGHKEQLVSAIVPNLVLTDSFQSFSICPRDQEVLQCLIHLIRHIEFMLKVRHRNRLLLVLCGLHRLLQRCVHYANEVSRQIRPKFSSSGRSSFRTGRASRSLAPPTGRAISYQPGCVKVLNS